MINQNNWLGCLACSIILLFASSGSAKLSAETRVLFSPSPDVGDAIAESIDSATETLDVAIYGLSDRTLQRKLYEAAQRGVRLRMILHDANRHETVATKIEEAGGDVRYVSKVMHHKFAIFDVSRLVTGSANWSRPAFTRYDEDLLIFEDQCDVIHAFQEEFNFLWANAKDFGVRRFVEYERTPPSSADVVFTSRNLKPVSYRGKPTFRKSTDLPGVCGARIIKSIESAKDSLCIATTHYRREDIHNAILAAIERGVTVRMVTDQQECQPGPDVAESKLYDEALALAGAEVRYKCYSPAWDYRTALQMHAKYLVIDGRGVLTGSFNWSEASEFNGFENLIAIDDRNLVARYQEHFKRLFAYRNSELGDILTELWQSQGESPAVFKPSSFRFAEMRAIQMVAKSKK